jgi:hypothetical protein
VVPVEPTTDMREQNNSLWSVNLKENMECTAHDEQQNIVDKKSVGKKKCRMNGTPLLFMFYLALLFLCVNVNTSTFIAAAFTPMSADGSALELANVTAYGQLLLSQGVSTSSSGQSQFTSGFDLFWAMKQSVQTSLFTCFQECGVQLHRVPSVSADLGLWQGDAVGPIVVTLRNPAFVPGPRNFGLAILKLAKSLQAIDVARRVLCPRAPARRVLFVAANFYAHWARPVHLDIGPRNDLSAQIVFSARSCFALETAHVVCPSLVVFSKSILTFQRNPVTGNSQTGIPLGEFSSIPTTRQQQGRALGQRRAARGKSDVIDAFKFGKACVRIDRLIVLPDFPTEKPDNFTSLEMKEIVQARVRAQIERAKRAVEHELENDPSCFADISKYLLEYPSILKHARRF